MDNIAIILYSNVISSPKEKGIINLVALDPIVETFL